MIVSGGRLEGVKNDGKFSNGDPKKWPRLLTRDGHLSEVPTVRL